MMTRLPGSRARHDAGALRFLLLLIGGWVLLRVLILWTPGPSAVPDPVRPLWAPPLPFAAPAPRDFDLSMAAGHPSPASAHRKAPASSLSAGRAGPVHSATGSPDSGFGADRHSLRLALMARLLPMPEAAAVPRPVGWFGEAGPARGAPAGGEPYWMQRPPAGRSLPGWSLSGWLYLREGSGGSPGGIAAASQLGGSQAGVRLAHGFGDAGRLRAYGRATVAIERPEQRELAFGLSFAPVRRWPVDIAVEQRVAVGAEGRTAMAAMVSGGVSEVRLPAGFRLDAYAQAGVVGARRRDGFADGAVVVDHRLGRDERAPFRLGALAAGAVQPGAARVDVGPRLTIKLPDVGQGSRIALDWRQRVAGDARPESGVALTLATDF